MPKVLHFVCEDKKLKTAKMLVQKSDEFNIDLNAKDINGKTAFHWACKEGEKKMWR